MVFLVAVWILVPTLNKSTITLTVKKKKKREGTGITDIYPTYKSPMRVLSNYRLHLWEKGMVTVCNIVIKASVTSLLIFFEM